MLAIAAAGFLASPANGMNPKGSRPATATSAGLAAAQPYALRLPVDANGGYITVYANRPLDRRDPAIGRALILVHGAGRDADEYFRSAMAAAYLEGRLDDTLVIAPRFAAGAEPCSDDLSPAEVAWTCDTWKFGEAALRDGPTSYAVMDRLLEQVSQAALFPNLRSLVVAGHSAGAQFVSRYALVNRVEPRLPLKPIYVAANASSYVFLDAVRPRTPTDVTRPHTLLSAAPRDLAAPLEDVRDPAGCTGFNQWPFGLENARGYARGTTPHEARRNLAERDLIILAGQTDNIALAGLDESCPAMFQGPNRLARAANFARYAREKMAAAPKLVVVPLCGHNARCMFTSPVVLPLIFPDAPKDRPGARAAAR